MVLYFDTWITELYQISFFGQYKCLTKVLRAPVKIKKDTPPINIKKYNSFFALSRK